MRFSSEEQIPVKCSKSGLCTVVNRAKGVASVGEGEREREARKFILQMGVVYVQSMTSRIKEVGGNRVNFDLPLIVYYGDGPLSLKSRLQMLWFFI